MRFSFQQNVVAAAPWASRGLPFGLPRHVSASSPNHETFAAACTLLLGGVITHTYANSTVFLVATCVVSLWALRFGHRLITSPETLRLSWILSAGLLLGYGLGTLNTAMMLWMRAQETVASYTGRSQQSLSTALGVAMGASAILLFVGCLEPPLSLSALPEEMGPRERRLIWVGFALVAVALMHGDLGYMGAAVSESHVSPLGSIASLIAPLLLGATAYAIGRTTRLLHRIVLAAALLPQFVLLAPLGRRVLLFAILLAGFGRVLAGARVRKFSPAMLAMIAVAGLLLYVSATFFFALRHSVDQLSHWGKREYPLMEYVRDAVAHLRSDTGRELAELMVLNVEQRTFILGYLSDVVEANATAHPLYGKDVWFALRTAVPSVLDRHKSEVLSLGMEEAVTHPQLGLPVYDAPNSILTSGISDLGLLGVVLYPLALIGLYRLLLWACTKVAAPPVLLFVYLAVSYTLVQAEASLPTYFTLARDLLVVVALFGLVYLVPPLRRILPVRAMPQPNRGVPLPRFTVPERSR